MSLPPQVIKIKRALAPGNIPMLTEGELAVDYLSVPAKLYSYVPPEVDPSGITDLLAVEGTNDAPEDTLYGRIDGQWYPVVRVSETQPVDPYDAQLWFDGRKLFIWHDKAESPLGRSSVKDWIPTHPHIVSVSVDPPSDPVAGDLWFDANHPTLYVYYEDESSSQWVVAVPVRGGDPGPAGPRGPVAGLARTTSAMTVPEVGNTVSTSVDNLEWLEVGAYLSISSLTFLVQDIVANTVTLMRVA